MRIKKKKNLKIRCIFQQSYPQLKFTVKCNNISF
jgi:hypothetical protein